MKKQKVTNETRKVIVLEAEGAENKLDRDARDKSAAADRANLLAFETMKAASQLAIVQGIGDALQQAR